MLEMRLRSFPRNRVIWFAEEAVLPAADDPLRSVTHDQIRFQQAAKEPSADIGRYTTVSPFTTLLTDLTVSEDEMWGAIHGEVRRQIARTIDDPRIEIAWLRADVGHEHFRFLTAFLSEMRLWVPRRAVFSEYVRRGLVSSCRVNGELAVLHVNLVDVDGGRARQVWSARTLEDRSKTEIHTAKLNKLLCWRDLLHFRNALKLRTYDWGGIALTDAALSGVNEFKRQFGGRLVTEWNVAWESPLYARLRPAVGSTRNLLRRVGGGWRPVTGE